MNRIGIMQGRLIPPVNNAIQAFPEKNWKKEFPLAHELNLDCIEFIFDGDNCSRHPLMTVQGLQEIKELEQKNTIQVLSICATYFIMHPLHRGDAKTRANNIVILKNLINNCSNLDVRDIVIPCVDNSKLQNPAEVELFKAGMNECLLVAEDNNLNLTLETDLGPAEFTRLMQDLNRDNCKINYDTGDSASLGYDPEVELQCYGKWITDVHIKDRFFGGSTISLGEGDVNFSLVFKLLKDMNYNGILILQAARKEAGNERETIKEYLDYIGKFL
jgi:hexulose-6-phosphate isomerase